MGIRVRLCSDWCLREADILSDYPQTSVSCIVRTQYPYFAQRYAGITGFYCIGFNPKFYYFESCARPPSVLRDILKGEPRHWRYAESAFLPEPVQRFYYSAGNEKMQRYSSFFMASMR